MTGPFTRHLTTPVPQTKQEDPRQVPNNAGGYTFAVSDETRLRRFLILGTEGGTYYQSERDLTEQNVTWLRRLIAMNEELVWETVRDVSVSALAYRNSPAIFALAYLFKYGTFKDTAAAQHPRSAKALLPLVCRTATHLLELRRYLKLLGVSGRQSRAAISQWYTRKTPSQAAYQLIKYRGRHGWTHRDVLRTAHPRGLDATLARFAVGRDVDVNESDEQLELISAFQRAQGARDVRTLIGLLNQYPKLPWEAIPTQFHKELDVWLTLFHNGSLRGQALVRNITRIARLGGFNDLRFAHKYGTALSDSDAIAAWKLHPIQFLNALVVHREGQVDRRLRYPQRVKNWETSSVIADALERGFYRAFQHTEPLNRRTLLALDVSGSMSALASGLDLSCAQVSAALAMTVARMEPQYLIRGFTGGYYPRNGRCELTDLGFTASTSLVEAMKQVHHHNFGTTDCSLPMEWALQTRTEIDTFVVLTDNETYAGNRHPHVALRDYREKTGIDARLIVVGMTATEFTIADPSDSGMLDVVGADASLPRLITDFSVGRV